VPLYEYACLKCGRHTDKIEPVAGPHLKKCPHCGGKVESVITAPAIKFKGAGWYVKKAEGSGSNSSDSKESSSKDSGSKDSSSKESSSKDSSGKDSGSKESSSSKESKEKKSSTAKKD
jgi:putative FmdB family regulatory protein